MSWRYLGRLDRAVKRFVRGPGIDVGELAKAVRAVSRYAYVNVLAGEIELTERGARLDMKRRILAYAAAKYIAWQLGRTERYGYIKVDSPNVTVGELARKLGIENKVAGARVSELKKHLAPVARGVYVVRDLKKALEYISGASP